MIRLGTVVPMEKATLFDVDDTVWYAPSGPRDKGTVVEISTDTGVHYWVSWHNGDPSDWYTATQLRLASRQRKTG